MRRDPSGFKNRFKAYKEGKSIKEIYDIGLPKYEDGRKPLRYWDNVQSTAYNIPFIPEKQVKLTNAGLATGAVLSTNLLDSIADNAYAAGLPIETALGLAVKESTLGNPTDDRSAWNLSSHIRRQFNNVYPGTVQHINKGEAIDPVALINYYKGDIDYGWRDLPNQYGELFSQPVKNQSVLKTGFEFYKQHPNKYNPGQPGHQKAVDARGSEVMQSPEVKKWYKGWEAKQVKVMRPKPYSLPTIQSTAPKKFGSYKDGKLPKYEDGKRPKGDGTRYLWDDQTQEWDRYTGDANGNVFADFVVTPRGGAHKKDIEPIQIVTPEQQQYSQRNKPTVSTNSTWHYTPAASTFVGRAVQAAGGDWKSADIASAGASLHPLLSVPLGVMDTGYNLNQSLHDLTDANKHVNTALSAASILPLVGGIKLLKGKDVGTKLLNAYNNYMYSLGNVDDINNTLRNIKYLDSAADATPAVKGVYQDYSFNGRNLFEEMQKRYAREELAGTFKPIDLHDIAKSAYVKDMGRMGILEGKKYDNYNSVVQSVLENSIYPRMQAMRQWIPQEKFQRMFNTIADGRWTMHPVDTFKKAFGKNTTVNGLYTPSTGNIAVRAGGGGDDISDILLHEIRHKIDDGIPLTEEETNILRAAYGDKFMEIPKVSPDWDDTGIGADYDMWPEAVTTNRDARSMALGPMERRMNVYQQNLVIDKLSDQQILEAVANANGYGRRFVDNLIGDGPLDASLVSKEQIKAWREAMKKVGMTTGFGFLGASAIKPRKRE